MIHLLEQLRRFQAGGAPPVTPTNYYNLGDAADPINETESAAGWSFTSTATVSTDSYDGTWAILGTQTTAGADRIQHGITTGLTIGKTYELFVHAKSEDATNTTFSASAFIGDIPDGAIDSMTYIEVSGLLQASEIGEIYIKAFTGGIDCTVWIDNIKLYEKVNLYDYGDVCDPVNPSNLVTNWNSGTLIGTASTNSSFGTWSLRVTGNGANFNTCIGELSNNLIIGNTYSLTFAVTSKNALATDNSNATVQVEGIPATKIFAINEYFKTESVTFTATSTTHNLELTPTEGTEGAGAYLEIDNIRLIDIT